MANEYNPLIKRRLLSLDKLCDSFESQWRTGVRPTIEDYLSHSDSSLHSELFEELFALEIAFRSQRGESPSLAEYVQRFPEYDTLVKGVLSDPAWHQQTTVEQETVAVEGGRRSRPLGTFGSYELLAEIGRGGMGVVYKAYQPSLDRTVAIKMISSGEATPRAFVDRFQSEAKLLARLPHPGIVPVFDVGCVEGQHFFSMEYVEGQSLAQRISAGPMTSNEAAKISLEIAQIIHFAHEQGVLHRDIKPSNVLINAQGRTRVMDFGLAKHVEGDSQHTRSGEVFGTPSYMSPEQASGRWREVDRRSDVYSLGALLYALLVRRPPFQEATPLATLLSVVQTQPIPPRSLNPAIDSDLERICLKCLDKDPARRYATAGEMAEDLQRYLQVEPAKQSTSGSHVEKRSATLTGLVVGAIAFVAVAIVITLQTPKGTVIIDVPTEVAANLHVRAMKDGTVEVVDNESKWSLRLKEGKYDLQLVGGEDQFKLNTDSIVVTRGRETRLTITRKAADPAPAPVSSIRPAAVANASIPVGSPRVFAKHERLGKQALVERPEEIKNVHRLGNSQCPARAHCRTWTMELVWGCRIPARPWS